MAKLTRKQKLLIKEYQHRQAQIKRNQKISEQRVESYRNKDQQIRNQYREDMLSEIRQQKKD